MISPPGVLHRKIPRLFLTKASPFSQPCDLSDLNDQFVKGGAGGPSSRTFASLLQPD